MPQLCDPLFRGEKQLLVTSDPDFLSASSVTLNNDFHLRSVIATAPGPPAPINSSRMKISSYHLVFD